MNNTNSNGLKKIYLFKSADYQFAEIDLSDNTLLLGESGVGKTTLMRVILFFYTMDASSSALNINRESKKSFNQWYFQERNSHIVYEYYKEENPYLFVLSNSGKLHYTFIDMSNSEITVKDLFLVGREPVTLEKLNENIEKHLLPKYHTTQKEKYIRAFHKRDIDDKKIKWDKKEHVIDFSLFESMVARKEFAKTLSNIFATSKVSADSVKKTIVSLIEDTTSSINLKNIKESLDDYVQFRTQIRHFEKKIPKINELKKVIDEYKENKTQFTNHANQIHLIKNQSEVKLIEIDSEVLETEEKKKKLNLLYTPKISQITENIKTKENEIYSENKEIKKIKVKKDEYQAQNIDTLVLEYENKKSYENSLEIFQKKYNALTSNANELKERYTEILQKLEKDKDASIFELKDENRQEKEILSNEKIELIRKEATDIEEETLTPLERKKELESQLSLENKALGETNVEQAKVENFPYNQELILQFSDEVKKFEKENINLAPQIEKIQNDMNLIDEKITHIPIKLKEEKNKLHEQILIIRNKLFSKKEAIEKKLDFDKNNLYSYILHSTNKNQVNHRDKLLTFLKDEILFSEKQLHVEKLNDATSIFGLEIKFENEDFGFDYEVSSLQTQLGLIKTQIKEQNVVLHESNKALEEEARKETSTLNRKRTDFYKEKEEKEVLEKKYKTYIIKSQNNLDDAQKMAKERRREATDRLNKQAYAHKENIKIIEDEIKVFVEKTTTISKKIKAYTKSEIQKIDAKINLLNKNEKNTIATLEEEYSENIEKNQKELDNLLTQNGIDEKVLKEINSEISNYSKKIVAIAKNENIVINYLSLFKQEIENIPSRESHLEKEKLLVVDLKEKLKTIKDEFQLKLDAIADELKKIEAVKKHLSDFIKKYTDEIENQPIEKKIKSVLILEYKEEVNDLLSNPEAFSTVIDNLNQIYQKLNNDADAIINKTQRATQGLDKDNIFKLDIVDNYMEESNNVERYLAVSNGLIEYLEKDKISILKETSSSKYINYLNAISKDIALFEASLLDIEVKVNKLDKRVKKAVESFKVIDSIRIKKESTNNEVLEKLKLVTQFYAQSSEKLLSGLFSNTMEKEENRKVQDILASKIEELVSLLSSKKEYLSLEEGFVLTFLVTENGNKLPPAQTLNDIGSNGTSTLVKSIINISLLQMVNEKSQILNHCILDEIGTISPTYFKELKDYANSSGFLFVNGMPTEDDILISMYPTVYIGQRHGKDSRMLLASKMVV